MNKKPTYWRWLLTLTLGIFLWTGFSAEAQQVNRNIANSTVTTSTATYVPGASNVVLNFVTTTISPDAEWIIDASLDFPTGVTVVSATSMLALGGELVWNGVTGNGVTTTWGDGSDWFSNGDIAPFTVTVNIDPAFSGDMNILWLLEGDTWGAAPHTASGTITIVQQSLNPGLEILTPHLSMGYRPIGAWMEPASFEIVNNPGAGPMVITTADIDNNYGGFIDVVAPSLPFTLAEGATTTQFGLNQDVESNAVAGAFNGTFAVIYGTSRALATATYDGIAYVPPSADVVETAVNMGILSAPAGPYEVFQNTDRELYGYYKNYILPNDVGNGPLENDFVYKFTLSTDKLFGITTPLNPNLAIYAEDFGGEPGPMAHNAIIQQYGSFANIPLFAGTYYLVISDVNDWLTASFNIVDMPLPDVATYVSPLDGAININNGMSLNWTLGANTFEYQVILGTTYPPTTVVVPFTSNLATSYTLAGLQPNMQYFWQVNTRNTQGTTNGPVWGFTTTIDVPTGLTVTLADPAPTAPTVSANLNWTGPSDRAFIGYNVYRNGVKINTTPITVSQYTDLGLARNTSYSYRVSNVFDEGESALSAPVTVTTKGVGIFSGFVYNFLGGAGIQGATVRLTGPAGDYTVTTAANGSYSSLAYAGTYEFIVSAAGFTTQNRPGQAVAHGGTTFNDFYMMEVPYPVGDVVAFELNSNSVQISWDGSGPEPVTEWLSYDDGVNFDGIGAGGTSFAVASRWTPALLAPYAGTKLTKVQFFPSTWGTSPVFELNVWTGTTPTLVHSQPITSFIPGQWNEVVLTVPVDITGTEEVWFGYTVISYSGWPAGIDAGPAVDGFGNKVYLGGAWNDLTYYGLDGNWNLRGFVTNASTRDARQLVSLENSSFNNMRDVPGSSFTASGNTNTSASAALPKTIGDNTRGIISYDVWRQKVYQPGTLELIGTTFQQNFVDFEWGVQDWGVYRWAVTVNYDAGQVSAPTYSNTLEKGMTTEVDVTVTLNSNESAAGTLVTFTNLSEPALNLVYEETLGSSGQFTWTAFRKGVYDIDVFKAGYTPQSMSNVEILDEASFEFLLIEILAPPADLYVTPTGFATWTGGVGTPFEPFTESFDGLTAGQIPAGWSKTPDVANWGAHLGANAGGTSPQMRFYWSPSGINDFYLKTPVMSTIGQSNLQLSFRNMVDEYTGANTLKIIAIADGVEYVIDQWVNETADRPASMLVYDLTAAHGVGAAEFQIAWVYSGDTWNIDNWYIDDVTVVAPSAKGAKSFQAYKVFHDGVLVAEVGDPQYQYGTNGEELVDGETYLAEVATVYTTGQSPRAAYTWTYIACDNYAAPGSFAAAQVEGTLNVALAWTIPTIPAGEDQIDFTRIYRNGEVIDEVTTASYLDEILPIGTYTYCITFVYESGAETCPAAVCKTVVVTGGGLVNGNVKQAAYLGGANIEGAEITLTNTVNSAIVFTFTTNAAGNYSGEVLAGTYNYLVEAEGYAPQTLSGVYVAQSATVTRNFELMEYPFPVSNVVAVDQGTSALIYWNSPGTNQGGGGNTVYEEFDNGMPSMLVVDAPVANWTVANDFLNLNTTGTGAWRSAYYNAEFSDCMFEVEMQRTAGATTGSMGIYVRGTGVMDPTVGNGSYANVFTITQSGSYWYATLVNGDLMGDWTGWLTSSAINTTGPNVLSAVASGTTVQFMVNGILVHTVSNTTLTDGYCGVFIAEGTAASTTVWDYMMIEPGTVVVRDLLTNHISGETKGNLQEVFTTNVNTVEPMGLKVHTPVTGSTRELLGYNVWRNSCDETAGLTFLGYTLDSTFVDNQFGAYEAGVYKWAVEAVYSQNTAVPQYSNCLDKDMITQVSVTVITNSGDSPEETDVMLTNTSEPGLGLVYEVELDASGYYLWEEFRKGTYDVYIEKNGFSPIMETVEIDGPANLTYILQELLNPVADLHVTPTGFATWRDGGIIPFEPSSFDFEADAQGWEIQNAVTGWRWGNNASLSSSFWDFNGNSTNFIAVNADAAGSGGSPIVAMAKSPMMNLENADQAFLSFDYKLYYDAISVHYSIAGGAPVMLEDLADYDAGWTNHVITLPEEALVADVQIIFLYTENGTWGYGGGVDNVVVTDEAPDAMRALEYYKVWLDGIFITDTENTYYQYDPAILTPGQEYFSEVAAMYSNGMSAKMNYTWTYYPCDSFPGPDYVAAEVVDINDVVLDWSGSAPPPPPTPIEIVVEPFEIYTAGGKLAQQAVALGYDYWTTWSGTPGSAEDPTISTAQASQGTKSVVIEGTNDAVLLLDSYTDGKYKVKFDVYIPSGKVGYFNLLQKFQGASSQWGMQAYFDLGGAGRVDAGGQASATFSFAYNTWHTVVIDIDLDADQAQMRFNNNLVVTWVWSGGSFGTGTLNEFNAMNLYAWAETGTPGAFFDNIIVTQEVPDRAVSHNAPNNLDPSVKCVAETAELSGNEAEVRGIAKSLSSNRAVLYNNGPLVNSAGTGVGGADESILQSALGLNSYGFNVNNGLGYRMADDFVVDATWTVESLEFFAYQTGSTTTSTITGAYVQVYNGNPSAGGTVVYGDLTTNRMASTSFANIYRNNDGPGGSTNRPIMRVVCNVPGLTLQPGTYWVEYTLTGSLASGPWSAPITINGQTTTGNALQWTGAAWAALEDGGTLTPQGIPFLINGTVSGGGGGGGTFDPGEFLGANIYRNGVLIAEQVMEETYTDMDVEPGYYDYCVTFVYADGAESCLSTCVLDVLVTEDCKVPQNLTATLVEQNNEVTLMWNQSVATEFRYDDGVATAQLGSGTGTINTVLGAKHTTSAELTQMSWYLTGEGGPHNTIQIYVFGLTGAGLPDGNNVLYTASVTNTDNTWNTHTFPTPIVANGGFLIGVAFNGFVGIGTDDGVGAPYVFQPNTHYFVGDYTAGGWETWETYGFNYNGTIRATGEVGAKASYAVAPLSVPVRDKSSMTLVGMQLSAPVNTGEPMWAQPVRSADRAFLGYNIYKDGSLLEALWPETTYVYLEGEAGVTCYTVTAEYEFCGETEPSNEACVDIVTGVENNDLSTIRVYPNPSNSDVNIELTRNVSKVVIYNYLGQVVYENNVLGAQNLRVDVRNYEAGAYLVKFVTREGESFTKKVVVTH